MSGDNRQTGAMYRQAKDAESSRRKLERILCKRAERDHHADDTLNLTPDLKLRQNAFLSLEGGPVGVLSVALEKKYIKLDILNK